MPMMANPNVHESSPQQPLKRADGLILVLDTPKGRGVFASQRIEKGTTVEISPVLIFSETEVENHLAQTCLNHYTYNWPSRSSPTAKATTTQAIALGLGSLFNHSTLHQNVGWRRDLAMESIVYTALCDIEVGQELCISYGNGRLWFEDADANADAIADDFAHAGPDVRGNDNGHDGGEKWNLDPSQHQQQGANAREGTDALQISGLGGIETDLG